MLPDIVKRSDIRARPRFGPRDLADVWGARDPRTERFSPQTQVAVGWSSQEEVFLGPFRFRREAIEARQRVEKREGS